MGPDLVGSSTLAWGTKLMAQERELASSVLILLKGHPTPTCPSKAAGSRATWALASDMVCILSFPAITTGSLRL